MIQSQRELLSNFIMVTWVEYKIDIRRGIEKQRRRQTECKGTYTDKKKEREEKDEKSKVAKEQSGSRGRKQVAYYGSQNQRAVKKGGN